MDIHHTIQYGLIATASAVAMGVGIYTTTPSISISSHLSKDLQKIGKHDINIYCGPGYCDLADRLADQFESAKWKVNVESAISTNSGIGIRADAVLQKILENNINEPIKLEVQKDNKPWEIWIGKPDRKPVS